MKVINMDMNTAVLRGSKQDAYRCIKEGFAVLEAASVMLNSLAPWSAESGVTESVYSDTQLVNAEAFLSALSTSSIDIYYQGCLSKISVLHERLEVFMLIKEQLLTILSDVVDAYVDLTSDEQATISKHTTKVLEQLSFFFFFEFNFDRTSFCIQKNEEWDVNEVVMEYAGKEGHKLEEKVLLMLDLYIKYRPIIPSVDFTDEQIDNFYYHTGVVAFTILDNIDALNPDIVLKLADGEITPEEVLATLSQTKGVKELDLFN